MNNKDRVLEFIKTQMHMVIASVDELTIPEAAFVGFAQKDDLSLVFGTSKLTRKYKNLEQNPSVALVFGGESGITVQYEGIATVLKDDELEEFKQIYFAKNPNSKKYEHDANQVYIKIIPSWIRYTDFNKEPSEIFEITF